MDPHLLILLEASLFILIFGGLPVLRREGLSLQLAAEVLILTSLSIVTSLLTGLRPDPIIFLILLYVVVMRCRVLIDLGNMLSSRRRQRAALYAYRLALRLGPDPVVRLMALINYSGVLVRVGALEEAVRILEEVLKKGENNLQPKHESACHYNLGVAYLRLGNDSRAVGEFNKSIDAWPLSPYAQHSRAALEKRRAARSTASHGEDRDQA